MVSFRPSLISSRSCSSGAYLVLSLSVFPLPIRFLSSASLPVLATQPLFLLFLFLPDSASQWLSRCALPLSLPRFPLSLRPDFSCLPSRFLYSALLFVSFRSSLLRSHSRSTGACLLLSAFSVSSSLSFVRLLSTSSYSASVCSFPSLPGSASQLLSRCPVPLSLPRFSPISPA